MISFEVFIGTCHEEGRSNAFYFVNLSGYHSDAGLNYPETEVEFIEGTDLLTAPLLAPGVRIQASLL